MFIICQNVNSYYNLHVIFSCESEWILSLFERKSVAYCLFFIFLLSAQQNNRQAQALNISWYMYDFRIIILIQTTKCVLSNFPNDLVSIISSLLNIIVVLYFSLFLLLGFRLQLTIFIFISCFRFPKCLEGFLLRSFNASFRLQSDLLSVLYVYVFSVSVQWSKCWSLSNDF